MARRAGESQEREYEEGHDYAATSPHLKHPALNAWIVGHLHREIDGLARRLRRPPRVLEVGAGHGSFTLEFLRAGASVVVTEMSSASAAALTRRFAGNERVTVVHDDGSGAADLGTFDAVVYLSVLHHIPDYVAELVDAATNRLGPEALVLSFQDPLWYPRMSLPARATAQVCFVSWRLLQDNLGRGARSLVRRLLRRHDENNVSDMTEYHVVRDGVDELAIRGALETHFDDVEVLRYWSTQSRRLQTLGWERLPPNSFGVVARRETSVRSR